MLEMVAFSGSRCLMEQFSPAELLRLIGRGGDDALPAIPAHLSYEEKLALRRARIDAIDRAQAERERPAEAPRKTTRSTFDAEDAQPATQAWLKAEMGNVYRLGPVWSLSEARAGYARWIWRAAVAGMLTKSRHDIKSPPWAISQLVRALVAGDIDDPRHDEQLTTWDDWPKTLYTFARVPLPERFNGR